MRITTKGQITIPQKLRAKYGFLPHSTIIFVEENGKIYLHLVSKKQQRRGRDIVERMRGSSTVRMTTDEILALTRGRK